MHSSPWCTSQSTTKTLFAPASIAASAASATLLKKQNPCAREHSAWCPGGRTTANARRASPESTARAACVTHPAASRAAEAVPGDQNMSPDSKGTRRLLPLPSSGGEDEEAEEEGAKLAPSPLAAACALVSAAAFALSLIFPATASKYPSTFSMCPGECALMSSESAAGLGVTARHLAATPSLTSSAASVAVRAGLSTCGPGGTCSSMPGS